MGTRNLTMVVSDGKTKIAQYGQWDGYPSGQGQTILSFLRKKESVAALKGNLEKCRFIESDGRDKAFVEEYDKNAPQWSNDPDNRTAEQRRWFSTYASRDLAADILENVAMSSDSEILLRDNTAFAKDSLFCGWAYVVDFDKNTFEVYRGFNTAPLGESERFYSTEKPEKEYYPVRLVASFDLNDLPSDDEFIAKSDPQEVEED